MLSLIEGHRNLLIHKHLQTANLNFLHLTSLHGTRIFIFKRKYYVSETNSGNILTRKICLITFVLIKLQEQTCFVVGFVCPSI